MNKVQDIHNSRLYGIFVETGCSTALSSRLMDESGASNTVYYSLQPYSKQFEHKRYGEFVRSVSNLFVTKAVMKEMDLDVESDANFYFVQSWQMSDGQSLTHGWMGFATDTSSDVISLHFSLPQNVKMTREATVKAIGDLGVAITWAIRESSQIAHKSIIDSLVELDSPFILDMAYKFSIIDKESKVDYHMLLEMQEASKRDYPLVFTYEDVERFEDLMRQGDEFIVQKGSFNPLHHQHVSMMTHAKGIYPNGIPAFLISTYRYDKPHIDVEELIARIDNVTSNGYPLIVCKEVFFYNTFKLLLQFCKRSEKKFYFPMGSDTINRIYKTDNDAQAAKHDGVESPFATKVFIDGMVRIWYPTFRFLVHKRKGYEYHPNIPWYGKLVEYVETYEDDGTSSTAIREGKIKNKL